MVKTTEPVFFVDTLTDLNGVTKVIKVHLFKSKRVYTYQDRIEVNALGRRRAYRNDKGIVYFIWPAYKAEVIWQ